MSDVTPADAMKVIAEQGGPDAAALYASIMDQQSKDREATLPTWETVERERRRAYERGLSDGYDQAQTEMLARFFGEQELA